MERRQFFCPNGHGFTPRIVDQRGEEVTNLPGVLEEKGVETGTCLICGIDCTLEPAPGRKAVLIVGSAKPEFSRKQYAGIVKSESITPVIEHSVRRNMRDAVDRKWTAIAYLLRNNDAIEVALMGSPVTAGEYILQTPPFNFTDPQVVLAVFVPKDSTPDQLVNQLVYMVTHGVEEKRAAA